MKKIQNFRYNPKRYFKRFRCLFFRKLYR